MPRWYLHVHDGKDAILDPEGSELPDVAAAHEEALAAAREMVADGLRGGKNRAGWRFEIFDQDGAPVLMVPFSEAIRESGG